MIRRTNSSVVFPLHVSKGVIWEDFLAKVSKFRSFIYKNTIDNLKTIHKKKNVKKYSYPILNTCSTICTHSFVIRM